MSTAEFLKTKVDLFKNFSDELIRDVVDGSACRRLKLTKR
jgi:hypothetical protein